MVWDVIAYNERDGEFFAGSFTSYQRALDWCWSHNWRLIGDNPPLVGVLLHLKIERSPLCCSA